MISTTYLERQESAKARIDAVQTSRLEPYFAEARAPVPWRWNNVVRLMPRSSHATAVETRGRSKMGTLGWEVVMLGSFEEEPYVEAHFRAGEAALDNHDEPLFLA